jgi:hypothetical protein
VRVVSPDPAPRVFLLWDEQWPRALLRAQLRESGYDAIGARTLSAAFRYPAQARGRGPVRLVLLEQRVLESAAPGELERLRRMHPEARVLLIARRVVGPPPGDWDAVMRRPVTIARLAAAVGRLVPLRPEQRKPVDVERWGP